MVAKDTAIMVGSVSDGSVAPPCGATRWPPRGIVPAAGADAELVLVVEGPAWV